MAATAGTTALSTSPVPMEKESSFPSHTSGWKRASLDISLCMGQGLGLFYSPYRVTWLFDWPAMSGSLY